ncbi:MAG: glycosyltransferase [Terrimonas sp.]|nr:glycosyltransferase [Terrimonas sp.]
MAINKQIFETSSLLRWRAFQWTTRFILFGVLLMIPVVWITLYIDKKPELPLLASDADVKHVLSNPVFPKDLSRREFRRYSGIQNYIRSRNKVMQLMASHKLRTNRVRAAFYVDWDPQSFYSLQKNIDKLNMVFPEWFFIDPVTDILVTHIDGDALQLMKRKNVKIVPILNNTWTNPQTGESEFNGALLHRIFHQPEKRQRLIDDIVKNLQAYHLQGVNIDFEEFRENSDEPIINFQKALYERLHHEGLMVTQDIMPNDADFNIRELNRYNDYLVLMAYDQHYSTSVPGPVSGQQWIEKVLDESAADVPTEKIILAFAGYGYDWPKGAVATTVTYQEALATAKEFNAKIDFDNDHYNNDYTYTDGDQVVHTVYFNDAASNFNTIRFADEYGTAGTVLWRLGSEDERLWSFYNRDLDTRSLQEDPFDYNLLRSVNTPTERPDYIGDGEILSVISDPQQGIINVTIDSNENIIAEQNYVQLPTKYVIKRYGVVNKQVILTFDDGPDPRYTPAILKILEDEKVPATFFVVGIQVENNLPLLKRIFKEGFEIGNHTFTHPNIAAVGQERALTEMESTRLLIEAATGSSTILFRAPYNADAEPQLEVELKPVALSKRDNYYTVGESIDPNDWDKNSTADSIYNRVVRQYEKDPSKGIILLHDAGGDRQATVDALPRIIHYFKQKGIQFTTVANLLGKRKEVIMPPAHSNLLEADSKIAFLLYWLQRFLMAAFWVAIILGLLRILIMAVMVVLQKIKSQTESPLTGIAGYQPKVSIIVPAYNEEVNAVRTIQNLLKQDYPFFDIIFVDDGSKDETYLQVYSAFADHPRVNILTKTNGGKASALNFGIRQTTADFVVCVDADTQLKTDAISKLMQQFSLQGFPNRDEQESTPGMIVGAVAGNVKVGNEKNLITKWQSIEYTTAQNFDRRAFDLVNGITVVPGAIGAFRKKAIEAAGGFTSDTLAEDCDLTIRILRHGYKVVNCPEAIAVTEAPETLRQFTKQRFRWSYGVMQSFWKNRDACFNPRYRGLGMIALPNVLIFQIFLPLLAPLADIMLLAGLFWNRHNPASLQKIGTYYLVFLLVDMLVSMIAFAFEKEKLSKLIWIIPQRFAYRQIMYLVFFKAIRKAIKGQGQGWGVLKRTGNVKMEFQS